MELRTRRRWNKFERLAGDELCTRGRLNKFERVAVMDVKTILLIFFGSILIQASIFGVEADKISEKDREVLKLANQGNHLEETAAVRGLSLENKLQKRLIKEDIEENRKKRAEKVQTRQEDESRPPGCTWFVCDYGKENRQKRAEKVQTREEDEYGCEWINGGVYCDYGKENRQKRAGNAQIRQKRGCLRNTKTCTKHSQCCSKRCGRKFIRKKCY